MCEEWSKSALGNHVKIFGGLSPASVLFAEDGLPFVKVEDLNNCQKFQVDARDYVRPSSAIVPAGSVIFPKRGAAIMLNKVESPPYRSL